MSLHRVRRGNLIYYFCEISGTHSLGGDDWLYWSKYYQKDKMEIINCTLSTINYRVEVVKNAYRKG